MTEDFLILVNNEKGKNREKTSRILSETCGRNYFLEWTDTDSRIKINRVHIHIPFLLHLVTVYLFCFWDKIFFFLIDEVNVNKPQHRVSDINTEILRYEGRPSAFVRE